MDVFTKHYKAHVSLCITITVSIFLSCVTLLTHSVMLKEDLIFKGPSANILCQGLDPGFTLFNMRPDLKSLIIIILKLL